MFIIDLQIEKNNKNYSLENGYYIQNIIACCDIIYLFMYRLFHVVFKNTMHYNSCLSVFKFKMFMII